MNAGVDLVQAYLHLNGYFTITELPVIRHTRQGYEEVTDLDILAVRFPWSHFTVPGGRPGPEDDLSLVLDHALVAEGETEVDVIIGEVKEGKARINDALRLPDALFTAVRRVGCVREGELGSVVDDLRQHGRAEARGGKGMRYLFRIVAFGEGKSERRSHYEVISLAHVAAFVESYLDRYHAVLNPADLPETALGILHLLRKLR